MTSPYKLNLLLSAHDNYGSVLTVRSVNVADCHHCAYCALDQMSLVSDFDRFLIC